jgi:hypothetical protein
MRLAPADATIANAFAGRLLANNYKHRYTAIVIEQIK